MRELVRRIVPLITKADGVSEALDIRLVTREKVPTLRGIRTFFCGLVMHV